MKHIIIILGVVVLALIALTASAEAAKYALGTKVGIIDATPEKITVYEVAVSASTTCYVTQQGKFGMHAMSCVK